MNIEEIRAKDWRSRTREEDDWVRYVWHLQNYPDPYITKLLLGVPLPAIFNDPVMNGKLREALKLGHGYYEVEHLSTAEGIYAPAAVRTVLDTLIAWGRLLPAWELSSVRTGHALLITSEEPVFDSNGVMKANTSLGRRRYRREQVYITRTYRKNPQWMRSARVKLAP